MLCTLRASNGLPGWRLASEAGRDVIAKGNFIKSRDSGGACLFTCQLSVSAPFGKCALSKVIVLGVGS